MSGDGREGVMEGDEVEAAEHREWARIEMADVERELREALAARAARLGLEPGSITSQAPGAVVARTIDGSVVRLDAMLYERAELDR